MRKFKKLGINKIIFYLLLAVIFSIYNTGCKREIESPQPTSKNNGSNQRMLRTSYQNTLIRQNPIAFAEQTLTKIAGELAQHCSISGFRNFIYYNTSLKFDEEYEVLIQDLLDDNTWGSVLSTDSLLQALEDFKDIDGSNFYPQIYIPSLQKREDEPNTIIDTSELYFIVFGGDRADVANSEYTYPAYTWEEDHLEYYGLVDEDFANTNDVWIFSLNESVNNFGNLLYYDYNNGEMSSGNNQSVQTCVGVDCDPDDYQVNGSVPFPELGHNKVDCKLVKLVVKNHKESWVSGASEVNIRAKLHTHNNRYEGLPSPADEIHYRSSQYSNYLGVRIQKVKRKDVGSKIFTLSFPLQTNWQNEYYQQDPVWFDYVIFERDPWPAGLQERGFGGRTGVFGDPVTPDWSLKYRAAEKKYEDWHFPYAYGSLCNTTMLAGSPQQYYLTGHVLNNDIEFTTSN